MSTEDHLDAMLDDAIEMTFPASDPFTIYSVEARVEEITKAERSINLELGCYLVETAQLPR
jgi:hypothetical protein